MRKPHTPQPPAEAHLIKVARKAAGLSIASAAARTVLPDGRLAVSEQRWGQIEQGFEWRQVDGEDGTRRRVARPVKASDEHLGHMAHAIELEPGRLSEAGRADGEDVLGEILRRKQDRPAAPRDPAADLAREIWPDPRDVPAPVRAALEMSDDDLPQHQKQAIIRVLAADYAPRRQSRPGRENRSA